MEKAKMKNSNNSKKTSKKASISSKSKSADAYVDVLYQRLGDKWFAFSAVGGELFFAEVPESAIQNARVSAESLDELMLGDAERAPEKDAA